MHIPCVCMEPPPESFFSSFVWSNFLSLVDRASRYVLNARLVWYRGIALAFRWHFAGLSLVLRFDSLAP